MLKMLKIELNTRKSEADARAALTEVYKVYHTFSFSEKPAADGTHKLTCYVFSRSPQSDRVKLDTRLCVAGRGLHYSEASHEYDAAAVIRSAKQNTDADKALIEFLASDYYQPQRSRSSAAAEAAAARADADKARAEAAAAAAEIESLKAQLAALQAQQQKPQQPKKSEKK